MIDEAVCEDVAEGGDETNGEGMIGLIVYEVTEISAEFPKHPTPTALQNPTRYYAIDFAPSIGVGLLPPEYELVLCERYFRPKTPPNSLA